MRPAAHAARALLCSQTFKACIDCEPGPRRRAAPPQPPAPLSPAAFREGRFEDAVACYTAALQEDGEHAPTLCNRSLAALKLGERRRWRQACRRSINPTTLAAHSSGCPHHPRAGDPEAALQDAEAALQLLCEEAQVEDPGTAACGGSDVPADSPLAAQLAKAFHRKAEALLALERVLDGIKTYRQGVAVCGPRPELHAALRLAAEQLPVLWLAKVC